MDINVSFVIAGISSHALSAEFLQILHLFYAHIHNNMLSITNSAVNSNVLQVTAIMLYWLRYINQQK